jgi:hypothetical protein
MKIRFDIPGRVQLKGLVSPKNIRLPQQRHEAALRILAGEASAPSKLQEAMERDFDLYGVVEECIERGTSLRFGASTISVWFWQLPCLLKLQLFITEFVVHLPRALTSEYGYNQLNLSLVQVTKNLRAIIDTSLNVSAN